jgi:DNA phosphorothioation-dependent restriction protein DptH
MNRLAYTLANIIREKIRNVTNGRNGTSLESRFIFHGPPREILEAVYNELILNGGIHVQADTIDGQITLPVLLLLPFKQGEASNPDIGVSGMCDESHLLHIRNDPHCPSFVALVPPGLHNNRSVASTTDEFGINASTNTEHATFEEWWDDSFIQQLITGALHEIGFEGSNLDDARRLVHHASMSVDEVDKSEGARKAAWRLLSRIYSINKGPVVLPPATLLALACGVPPMQDGNRVSSKSQIAILEQISDGMEDGFKTGVERILTKERLDVDQALEEFLQHVQMGCEVPTAFERATEAFYLPLDLLELEPPPAWWAMLTTELWSELLIEENDDQADDLSVECVNSIISSARGIPAVVLRDVVLSITTNNSENNNPIEVQITGGSHGKKPAFLSVDGLLTHQDEFPPIHKLPITYKVIAAGRKPAASKVISLESWYPGLIVFCRVAKKISLPKKPRKSTAAINWETSLVLPGSGRHELILFISPGTSIKSVIGINDDATEVYEGPKKIDIHKVRESEYLLEIDAEGKYQLDINFKGPGRDGFEVCRAYISCEEIKEEGCRSEFERLIKLNRRHLEKFDTKAVVQLDRHARSSSLQSWILDEKNISESYRPIVIADDYSAHWVPPSWDGSQNPILSKGQFLHDPRPEGALFKPPQDFIDARKNLASIIRDADEQLGTGLIEAAPLGNWLSRKKDFRELVETYLDTYIAWLVADPQIACWCDTIAVCPLESDGRTLTRVPDAIIISPMHPLRFSWHCLAQQVLYEEIEGEEACPCPAASILDPNCIPDLLTMTLQAPGGLDKVDFLSVECNSDYWSVLWNGSRLSELAHKSRRAPFDNSFGLTVGGIANGFSPAQVSRALEDVSDLLAAKPILSIVVSSEGGATDSCNDGLTNWCAKQFGNNDKNSQRQSVGPRVLEVFDIRGIESCPDQATIANLSEDTANHVRWFNKLPNGAKPDLGIIAQLNASQPESKDVGMRSPLGIGGLIRHRVRRQLHGVFLSESRQGLHMPLSGETLADKISECILIVEGQRDGKIGLQFAPNIHAVSSMLEERKAGYVAVSSTAIDPACFLGGWINGAYLWDYDLPSYSHRAGDASGYYLLSHIKGADRDALRRVLNKLPECDGLEDGQVEQILLEVAKRGIPTVRGLSGDDTGATGDLGLFLAVRLLQDQFRISDSVDSLLPVLTGSQDDALIALIIPIDPFRGYLADLARSLGKARKDASLSRPDLLVVGIHVSNGEFKLHLTPIEVKCRQGSIFCLSDSLEALKQAKALSSLLSAIEERASKSLVWRLAFQHLLLSMISFGLRVYSQHHLLVGQSTRWASYHEAITATILDPRSSISIDESGRLIVVDDSSQSDSYDRDGDGLEETIVISQEDAGCIIAGDTQTFYNAVRSKVGYWGLFPKQVENYSLTTPIKGKGGQPEHNDTFNHQREICNKLMSRDEISSQELPDHELDNSFLETQASDSSNRDDKGISISIGHAVDGFEKNSLSLNISDTRLNQLNIGVVGDLGTGKTQFLKSLIFQITSATKENRGIKPKFLIFDYKGDYNKSEFVNATGARVVKPTQLPLNLFDITSMGESISPWLDRFRFFADVLDKVYSGIGPVQRDKLKGAVRRAYESSLSLGHQPTLYDIHTEYRRVLGGKSDAPMSIIDDLVDMEIFVRNPKDAIPFDAFLDGVVVISLDAMGQDDRSKNMLVAIILNMFYENMLKTPKRPFIGSDPQLRAIDSYLLVDEADHIMRYEFDVLRKLLLQGREFGSGVILASQYLRHFKTGATDYREPLLTWFIHKVPNVTAAELGVLGFTSDLGDLSERVKQLPNHCCLYKSFDALGMIIKGLPFYELMNDRLI